ncbi:hypothetical protein H310_00340 [Aphanomyces invadans]|uniref:Ion transport domain-containing protein n=1 Tax=Aphanomyces invadans TaxID=157072 RepID=A0A024UTT6_9STRA|nr:hypothetical protein H310_00340 [Aphanomyces invadans]ETW09901.1 hypothetical protein H310_00340 [Aphanomyces invadans]|eukprot:XP_008861312.1 hypothetical protein H310_00340 [Aphanomyces invadans]
MTRVEAITAEAPTMLKDVRRKSTETHVDRHRGPSLAEMRRCSTSITDLITSSSARDGSIARRARRRRFDASKVEKPPPPNTWRRRVRKLMKYPHATFVGRVRHYGILAAIVLNFVPMMMETMDGPANGGSDPKYPQLPSAATLFYMDVFFTGVSALEFMLRWIVAKRQRKFWTQMVTWIDVLGLLPLVGVLVMKHALRWSPAKTASVEQYLKLLRHFRIVRVTYMLRNISGIRVLHSTFRECMHPLQITLFFLVTIVMTLATLLYYAQPCYDGANCTFTDIINTGYFVMVTVATVGYGDQVPDLANPFGAFVVVVAMIFGALYLAMPLAIVGIKYEVTWRRFENVSRTTRSTLELQAELKAVTIQALHANANHVNVLLYDALDAVARLWELVDKYIHTPDNDFFIRNDELNQAFLDLHATGDEVIERFRTLLRHFAPFLLSDLDSPATAHRLPASTSSLLKRGLTLSSIAGGLLNKAKRATLHRRDTPINVLDPNLTFRQRLRAHLHATNHGSWAHRFYLTSVLLSVAVFYAESVPELQAFGPTSHLCHMLMESYCTSNPSPATDPGCYVWHNTTALAVPLTKAQFYCDNDAKTERCFGVGFNHGGNASTGSCAAKFAYPAHVCSLRECERGHEPLVDLTHHWIYIEVYLGITFTVELMLRCYVSSRRRHFFRSVSTWIDIMAILPFYAQTLAGLAAGRTPIYVSSPAFPTFVTVLPVMKTIRIVKLGWYFQGSSVLAQTALLAYQRLTTPLFFLFFACGTAGAVFFEIEPGTACYAGVPCMYLNKDLMTAKIAALFPYGKRIQIQLDNLVTLKDMWRTTWMTVATITGVGFGDFSPRTPTGRVLDILTMVFGSCYTAMPLSLIGGLFYTCYEHYLKQQDTSLDGAAKPCVGPTRPGDPRPTMTPRLPPAACKLVTSIRTVERVVDGMMSNLYKLNCMRPKPVVLDIPLEASMSPSMDTSSAMGMPSLGPSRTTLMMRIAPAEFGSPAPVVDKIHESEALRRLIQDAAAMMTTFGLQLPQLVEIVVAMTGTVDENRRS